MHVIIEPLKCHKREKEIVHTFLASRAQYYVENTKYFR
jgi:hypothetical protein